LTAVRAAAVALALAVTLFAPPPTASAQAPNTATMPSAVNLSTVPP
jgi:hypothetical protein